MLAWLVKQVPTLLMRLAVTLSACLILERVIREEGYRVEFSSLLVAAACILVTVRFWMPPGKKE